MHMSAKQFKVDNVPPRMTSIPKKFKSYTPARNSLREMWQGAEGLFSEDGHEYRELCAGCNKAFGDHFDNHCYVRQL